MRLWYDELYREFGIVHDPPPIPHRGADWQYSHVEHDGPGDNRCGHAATLEAAKNGIDNWYKENEA